MKALRLAVAAAAAAAGAAGIGSFRWNRDTSRARAALSVQPRDRDHRRPTRYSVDALDRLPQSVARYFRFALTDGQPLISLADFAQAGTMRGAVENAARWSSFRAVENFATDPPGFVWDAAMRAAPGVDLRIRDIYVDGSAASQAQIFGIGLGGQRRTPEVASASLVRFLAEAPWIPTVLLPGKGVQWSALGDGSARVTLTDAGTTVSLDVEFGASGEIVRGRAVRYRDVNGIPLLTPWCGEFRDYTSVDGMMIPLAAEVSWILADGPIAVWRGTLTHWTYRFADAEKPAYQHV